MESMTPQIRPEEEEQIECWDDDDDLQFIDGIQSRAASSTGSMANSSFRPSGHRDSISSRRSARSDLDSNVGDEDWQVPLHDDEFAKEEALASAKNAGIPIPANIPSSALLGGAIKRLSTRKPKRSFVDDWSEDVELPGPDAILQLRTAQEVAFPESIRQTSSAVTSPVKSTASSSWDENISTRLHSALGSLDRFRDDDDDSPLTWDVPTIKAPTPRSPQKIATKVTGRNPNMEQEDDFGQDLELPPDYQPLKLSHRKDTTGISSPVSEDFDLEWSEGSIGVRVGGTARDGRSIPSSSISIASPSVSSCLTGESEEDGLDGLVFPDGPLDFTASLKRREEKSTENDAAEAQQESQALKSSDSDDFFSGIEVDNGRAFASKKLTLNPNVKRKTEWPASPTRRSSTTLTFTTTGTGAVNTTGSPGKILESHAYLAMTGTIRPIWRPIQSASVVSTSPHPNPAGRRLLGARAPQAVAPVGDSGAPPKQLRTKRSLPSIRGVASTTSTQTPQRLPSHSDGLIRPSVNRPKTPVERTIVAGRTSSRRAPATFIPAGTSDRQSQHANIKTYRPPRRHNSDSSSDLLSPQGTYSRLSRSNRPESFRLSLDDSKTESASPTAKRTLTRPTRRRNFGDGTELESFDDLPTSVSTESRFTKNPAGRGAPPISARQAEPEPHYSPWRIPDPILYTTLDLEASGVYATRIASMNPRNRDITPLGSFNPNWKAHPISRISPVAAPIRSRKSGSKSQSKPHLIKPMGSGVQESKSVRGMHYNPDTYRWEGNENLVQEFDIATAPKSPKPAPALISNVGAANNAQAVGGMIFDPQRMCWLRATPLASGQQGGIAPEEEDDVFAGLDDLDDKTIGTKRDSEAVAGSTPNTARDDPSAGESSDEGPITEEFDVGPEFIRRQRAEEEKWRRKVDKWIDFDRGSDTHWRWAIRDLTDGMEHPTV
ncbi:hypothetical protein N7451_005442 [Penicillium sp. IBT 35674x]|nr:hypothetical protein N7451_005442 [Penicillium sp. IBT 35674x]